MGIPVPSIVGDFLLDEETGAAIVEEIESPRSSAHTIACDDIEFQMYIDLLRKNLNSSDTSRTEIFILDQFPGKTYRKLMSKFNRRILISRKVCRPTPRDRRSRKPQVIKTYTWCNACQCVIKSNVVQDHILNMETMVRYNHQTMLGEWLISTDQLPAMRRECIAKIEDKLWVSKVATGARSCGRDVIALCTEPVILVMIMPLVIVLIVLLVFIIRRP